MSSLLINTELNKLSYQVVAAFLKNSIGSIEYRILFKTVEYGYYLAIFTQTLSSGQFALVSLKNYPELPTAGSKSWKCFSNYPEIEGGNCKKCVSEDYVLTNGRCYDKINWCDAQVADICWLCRAGSFRSSNGQKCLGEPKQEVVVVTTPIPVKPVVPVDVPKVEVIKVTPVTTTIVQTESKAYGNGPVETSHSSSSSESYNEYTTIKPSQIDSC